jgi:hypothetical protein
MTTRFPSGLVVGKFYPPHCGHLHLIEAAAASCRQVTVLVMAARVETVPLADRVAWLRAACGGLPAVTVIGVPCDVPVDFGSGPVWTAQVAVMTAALEANGLALPAAVFSSEPYGDELAARIGAQHQCVDLRRVTVPVSASNIRADLAANWGMLIGPAQAGLAARVVVLGAESTGTSTIAELLAARYQQRGGAWSRTPCVPEVGGLQLWATTDLPRHDVYLVTSHEGVPWCDDGLREGDLAVRAAMTEWFTAALTAAGHSWVLLTGSIADRLDLAVRVTDAILAEQARFGPALTDDLPASQSVAP